MNKKQIVKIENFLIAFERFDWITKEALGILIFSKFTIVVLNNHAINLVVLDHFKRLMENIILEHPAVKHRCQANKVLPLDRSPLNFNAQRVEIILCFINCTIRISKIVFIAKSEYFLNPSRQMLY